MATLEGSAAPAATAAVPVRVRAVRHPFAVPHAPGLDGLRGLAVVAVVAYHLDLAWAGGGFLGVEVFFTLSGFLVTHLMVAELRRFGRVDVRGFLRARARRLVPALVLAVLGTLLLVALLPPTDTTGLLPDALASLTWLQNWHLLVAGVPYAESFGRPSPFLHIWSLAVEAQLYLIWPLLFTGVLAVLGRRRVAAAALLLAFASAVACAWRFDPDTSAAYYATDGRASGFLIGATTALLWLPHAWRRPRSAAARTAIDLAGITALVTLLVAVTAASEFATDLYLHGGFLRTGLVTAVVLVAATGAGPAVSGLLSGAPLVAIGRRSYGIYLYHWPILVLTRDLPAPGPLVDLGRILATLLVAEASYRWVETPIRRGAIGRLTRRARLGRVATGMVGGCLAGAMVCGVVALTASDGLFRAPRTPVAASTGATGSAASGTPTEATGSTAAAAATAAPAATGANPAPGAGPPATPPAATPPQLGPAYVLGDSIALGSADAITTALGPGTTVDAAVGRQYAGAPEAVRNWAARNPGPVVVDLGANGTVEADDVEHVVTAAGDRPVVLVGVSVPRRWEAANNAVLRAAAERHAARVRFVDWAGMVAADPGLLGPDDVHPTARGRTVLAESIRDALSP